jgi:phosphoribosyl 1,2-cyclic phosphodiesterase
MYVKFWGTRGSVPTPGPDTVVYGGNTSCIEVQAGDETIILDAGTGIRLLGLDIVRRPNPPKTIHILISHTHWDHIQGFPFFAPAFSDKFDIHIHGSQGTGHDIEKVLSFQMEDDYFPLSFLELSSSIAFHDIGEVPFSLGDVRVEFSFLNHPGLAMGYALLHDGKKVVYCPDVEPFRHNVLSDDTAVDLKIQDYVQDLDAKVIELARDADCLLIDGTYTEEEYLTHPGWGHSSFVDSIRVGAEANVRRIFLIHHDPGHDDAFLDGMLKKAQAFAASTGKPLECHLGREGLALML